MLRTKEEWEKIYRNKETPWNAEIAEPYLAKLIKKKKIKPGQALDLGCGTGNESIFLAKNRFNVTGIDISEKAILTA